MNNINVTIELCAEDRARLDNILEALRGTAPANKKKPAAAKAIEAAPEPAAPVMPEPQEEPAPQEQPKAETPAEPVPEVTAAELQSKVVKLVGAGKKDAARAVIQEYAPNVSSVPAEKRAEVLERLNALEG